MTELEHAARGERRPATRRTARWPWLIAGLVLAGLKARGWGELVGHPAALIPALAAVLAVSLLRPKPVLMAFAAAGLAALVVAPHPLLAGIGLGVGVFVVLMVAFMAIATILHARQGRSPRRRSAA